MEQDTAIRRTHPSTANDRSRLIVTTLLLLGGAFVLGLTWTVRHYRIFTDRVSAFVPASAEMVVTLPLGGEASSVLGGFKGDFGKALSSVRPRRGKTLVVFVDKDVDNGVPAWRVMTDDEIDEDALPKDFLLSTFGPVHVISLDRPRLTVDGGNHPSRLRFMRNGEGKGFIEDSLIRMEGAGDHRALPLTLSFEGGRIRLEIGTRLRGESEDHEFPVDARQMSFIPETAEAYTILPPDVDFPSLNGYKLESAISEAIRLSGMTAETVLDKNGSYAVLLHGFKRETPRIELIEKPIIDALSLLKPDEVKKTLPDGSIMTELRLKHGEVGLEEKEITGGLLRTHTSEDGRAVSLLILDDGRIWLTDDLNLVSGLIVSNTSSELADLNCQPTVSRPGVSISGDSVRDIPMVAPKTLDFLSTFKAVSYRLEDRETGLFTFCGYF